MFHKRLLWSLLGVGLLTACVAPRAWIDGGLEQGEDPDFDLAARFSLRYTPPADASNAPRQLSGRLEWRHRAEDDRLLFMDPLGQGVVQLERGRDGRARVEYANGQTEEAGQADQLLENALGAPLPFTDLLAWVRARPGTGARAEHDDQGRPLRVRESGWLIFYQYHEAARLPSRVDASLDGVVQLRLLVDAWKRPR
jgi:outer membrane lipoprotein LolB